MRFADYGKRVVFTALDGGEITSDAGVLLERPVLQGPRRPGASMIATLHHNREKGAALRRR